jgi:hypothetical protein
MMGPREELHAYRIMFRFLEDRYNRLPSDVLGGLLGELTLQQDGKPNDQAVVAEWRRAVVSVAPSEGAKMAGPVGAKVPLVDGGEVTPRAGGQTQPASQTFQESTRQREKHGGA